MSTRSIRTLQTNTRQAGKANGFLAAFQEYANWLADMLHGASGSPVGGGGSFRERIMRARLERLLSSEAAARYYAEMFSGLG